MQSSQSSQSSNDITLVVAGCNELFKGLRESGRFKHVAEAESIKDLKNVMSLLPLPPLDPFEHVVVLLSSDLPEDLGPENSGAALVKSFASNALRVIIVAQNPNAYELISKTNLSTDFVGLVHSNISVNIAIGAISGLPNLIKISPLSESWAQTIITPDTTLDFNNSSEPTPSFSSVPANSTDWVSITPATPEEYQPPNATAFDNNTNSWAPPTNTPVFQDPNATAFDNNTNSWAPPTNTPVFQDPNATAFDNNNNSWAPTTNVTPTAAFNTATRNGTVITITAPKGGTGKSTLAVNLAAFAALKLREVGKTVCIVDTNMQNADVGRLLDVYKHPNKGMLTLASNKGKLTPDLIQSSMTESREAPLYVLLGPDDAAMSNPSYGMNGALYTEAIQNLRSMFDYIILDTSVLDFNHDMFTNFVIPESDFIAIVVTPDTKTIYTANQAMEKLSTGNISRYQTATIPKNIGYILNQAEEDIGLDKDKIIGELSRFLFLGDIPLTKTVKIAGNNYELYATTRYQEVKEWLCTILLAITHEEVFKVIIDTTPTSKFKRFFPSRSKKSR